MKEVKEVKEVKDECPSRDNYPKGSEKTIVFNFFNFLNFFNFPPPYSFNFKIKKTSNNKKNICQKT